MNYGNDQRNEGKHLRPDATAEMPVVEIASAPAPAQVEPQAPAPAKPKRKHTVLKVFLGIFLVLTIVVAYFGFMLYSSVNRLSGHAEELKTAYETYETAFNEGDYETALTQIHVAADKISDIETELRSREWQAAAKAPYFGEDVQCAQEVAYIVDNLANEAMIPLITQLETSFGHGTFDELLERLPSLPSGLSDISNAIKSAKAVTANCKTRAEALPESHFSKLNELVGETKDAVQRADEIMDSLKGFCDFIDGVGGLISAITSDTAA